VKNDTAEEQKIVVRANYELFIVSLLLIQVFNSILVVTLGDSQVEQIPRDVGICISLFLMADVLFRVVRSPDRRRFLFKYHGYLLALGSLPIPFFSLLWLGWYWQMAMKLRRDDVDEMGHQLVVRKRAQSALLAVIIAAVLVLELSSILIIRFEEHADGALIVTADDAVWWSLVTMATVGYGDMYPVTTSGRIVAVFVMIVGVSIFTVLTSFLAQNFAQRHGAASNRLAGDVETPTDPMDSLSDIKQYLDMQEVSQKASINELRAKLDDLERLISAQPGAPAGVPKKSSTEGK